MKTTISVSVDVEVILKVKERGLVPSTICNEALWRAVGDPSLLNEKAEQINKELDELTRTKDEFARSQVRDKELAEAKVREFLKLPETVVDNKEALVYWSKILGRSVEELVRLRTQGSSKP